MVISAEIGENIILSGRKGNTWLMVAITNEKKVHIILY